METLEQGMRHRPSMKHSKSIYRAIAILAEANYERYPQLTLQVTLLVEMGPDNLSGVRTFIP